MNTKKTNTCEKKAIYLTPEYKEWLTEIKNKIRSTQAEAAFAVNSASIHFYWEIGMMITERQSEWGEKLIERISNDLKIQGYP